MTTIKDVAKRANVSVSTVSCVINDYKNVSPEVKEKVWNVIRDMNYKPNKTARNLAKHSTRCIGLFGPNLDDMKNDIFFCQLIAGILSVTTQESYNLIIYPEQKDQNGDFCIGLNQGEPIDGAIIMNPRITNKYLEEIIEYNVPFILVGRPSGFQESMNYVDVDNMAIGYNVTKHLIGGNHKKILFLNGPKDFTISIDRLEGYRVALLENGIPFSEHLVANSEHTVQDAMQAVANAIKGKAEFTAVIASSDTQAIGVVNVLREHNYRIPKDISLICGSETLLTVNHIPGITGVDLNTFEIGSRAAGQLLDFISKRLMKPTHQIIPYTFNLRESTAAIKARNYTNQETAV